MMPPLMGKVAAGLLPAPTTTFVGRQRDLQAVAGWFASGHRLVVIVGPPGMGKTRAALEYAAGVAARAAGRAVRFCDLTEVRDLDGLCTHVAACLGLSLEAGADVAASIGLALRDGGDLVVLDNFEQLVEVGAATVARWLAGAPRAQLLVTSRERLRIDGEVVHELEPLSLPVGSDPTESEATALFVDRARQLRRDFVLTVADAPQVAEIVRRLDGIPLAIEVAAARMDVMGPASLVERMPRRLDLLASGRRDATARQATLRGAIDGSWNALLGHAQAALAQTSVFRGGFTLDAAEAVIDVSAYPGAPAVVDVLGVLRAKSLLRAHGAPGAPAEPRFSLYESIRDYAAEKLAASGELAATRARHARYFLARFAAGRRSGRSLRTRHEVAAEHDNLIAVLEDAFAAPPTAQSTRAALDVLLAIDPGLPRSGPPEAYVGWLDEVLARPAELLGAPLRVAALLARGRALLARARFEHSLSSFTEACARAGERCEPRLEARARIGIGIAYHRRGRDDEARPPFERALEILRDDDPRRASVVHGYLGAIDQQAGRMHAARTHYRAALRAVETEVPYNRAFLESTVRLRLAFLALDEGNPADAQLECEQGIVLAIEARSRRLQGLARGCLALARWALGKLDEASELIAGSVHAMAEARDHHNEGFAQSIRGAILAARDRIDEAADAFAYAETALAAVGDQVGLAAASIYHGHLDLARARGASAAGDAMRAAAHRAEAERRAQASAPPTPARVALATLRRALDESAPHGDDPDDETLLIDHDRRWIRIPGRVRWVRFGRQAVPWRLFVVLCEARLRAPGQPIAADALIAAGWPGQSVLPTAAQNRLHVAVNGLRKLGLRQLIVTRDEGYLLTPSVRVRAVVNS